MGMINYFCKPKLKVGTEWVSKGQTCTGAASSVGGIGRKVYELVFRFITDKCNLTLFDPTMKKVQYIGCLDIAGFEIFDYNGFEQICINFVNEKLQQFFNQHMFTLEQEEYVREGIEWANVDFGMDLQVCITMFEKPMGLLAIWEEESLFPKATDDTFRGKLMDNLLGKPGCGNFQKPDPRAPDKNAHFGVSHYAAMVSYNLTGWLEKNKDPLNDTVVELIKNGSNKLLVECFYDHPGQPLEAKKDAGGGGKKKGGGKTVSSYFKGQLDDLMTTLYKTEPHFIRCVVPNTHKQPGGVQPELVMHQYKCNGVLAGIAICRLGFPNKLLYPDFKARYNILAAGAVAKAKNDKSAAGAVMDKIKLDKEKFRLGHTKVFFRAGILGFMEETREDKIGSVLAMLQAQARGKSSRLVFKKMQDQKLALYCLQRTIRNYRIGKTWLWWTLWLSVKPNLKCTKFAQYKAEYEEKIAIAEANIDKAVAECNKVIAEHDRLSAAKNEYVLALQSGGSAVQEIIDKTNRIEAMKNDVEKQLNETNAKIKELEATMEGCEEDKATKDSQIRTLKEEIVHQEELIAKLGKEKRNIGDSRQKTEEDIQASEDKCNHLSKVKGKLEQSLDECEDALEREKKAKSGVEKIKRKVEGDLKLTQEAVSDLERIKSELSQTVQRKEKELASMSAKIEDEQTLGSKYGRQIKELQSRLEEVYEELAIERQNRAKAEKNRSLLSRDIEDLGQKLEDAGNNTSTQIELNKKREAELAKLKGELEESNIAHEGTLAALRQKHNNNIAEMGEQIDSLNKMKSKADKDKAGMERDLQECRAGLDEAMRERANHERNGKMTQGLIVESNQKLDELARALNEADSSKKKLSVEKQDLTRQIDEVEGSIAALSKNKISLSTQLEDTKRLGDSEARDRAALLAKFKNLNTELENLKERIDEESQKKSDALKALSKSTAEIQLWKSKFETEGLGNIEELESGKAKLNARLAEAEETIENLNQKVASAEKTRHRMETELEDLQLEYERVHAAAIITEKRGRNFDKVIGEWKAKSDDLDAEVEASQKEQRNYSSELFRLKSAWDETAQQLDIVKRENKNLADEIKDLLDQLGDGGRSIHELDKQRRRLEVEKEELQSALEEAEAALEQEENKVLRASLELGQVRQEIDRKIAEKVEEFENTRKNHQRAMDSIQASLDGENKAKTEALRVKKKLEGDINELEIALDHANKANSESHKSIKRFQGQLRDVEVLFEAESRQTAELAEKSGLADRRGAALLAELEESNALLDSASRGKKQADAELVAARGSVNDMTAINGKAAADKRKLESAVHTLHAEIDDALAQAKGSEEKAKRAMVDAARLADELRAEQDHTAALGKGKSALTATMGELELNLGAANEVAAKGGRSAMAKLENRIHELEIELGAISAKTGETMKAFHRAERHVKELSFQGEQDKKNQDSMSDLAGKLQAKIKTYKNQIAEAEEIAALNLAKFRKAQADLESNEERAKAAGAALLA